jgi:signal transduction histidine kinase
MKKSNLIFIIILALISFVFTLTIGKIVPESKFDPYILQLDSLWNRINEEQEYQVDINNDYIFEKILHHNINVAGHSIEFHKGEKIHQLHIFEYGEKFIGTYLKFADIDSNSTQELIFVSALKYVAYLNIYSYNNNKKKLLTLERIKIDTIGKFNNEMDAVNNFITINGSDIYLDLQGSYSIQPRHIYKYNFNDKTIIKNRLNGLVTPEVHHFNYQNKNYLLASFARATGNTISPKETEMLRSSTDKDTLAMYQKYKHLEYEYGDFSSYILLYDDSLRFAFEPIEFFAWTNFTKSTIVPINDVPHIVSFTNAQMNEYDNKKCKLVTVCNLQGEIIKQIALPSNYTDIFSDNQNVIFYGDKTLFITDANLEPLSEIPNITFAQGYENINHDNKPEFIAFSDNTIKIYSSDFEINATFKIEQEFAPYPEKYSFATLQNSSKNLFVFNSRLFYYQFSYQKNNIAFLKYPFFITVFFVIFGTLYILFRLNSKRLEKENMKLELIVKERTKELATQKEEVQTQANELEIKNINLLELSKFKKLMTDTVIHDLKNPLNYIIGNTSDKTIRQSGYNMLNIILNVLDINKAQITTLNVVLENQNVTELLKDAIEQVEYLAEQKNLTFEKIIQKQFHIVADKDLTVRILVNLLTNAIKFSTFNNKITIQTIEKNEFLQIDITDYGRGISEENIKHIFDEYSQIEAKKSGNIQSTGLGLTFCKIAAEAQKAKISVTSVPNVKTTFSLFFSNFNVYENKIESTQNDKNETQLTHEDRKKIQHILHKLKNTNIFEATEILKLLNSINNSTENIELWKQKLKTAMYASNNELFYKLINNELQNIDN